MPERAKPMGDVSRTVSTDSGRAYDPHPIIGAAVAVMVAALYGQPTHVMVTTPLLLVMTGLGVTAGYHRLFAHHSFATFRSVERALMILGCMASCAPFFWVAIHRVHHRHSDRDATHTRPTSGPGAGSESSGDAGTPTSNGTIRAIRRPQFGI